MYIQQGDVILKQCEKPNNIENLKTDLLFKGQQHHHRMRGDFMIGKSGDRIFLYSKGSELFHEEHKTLQIPAGFYELSNVVEYDHMLEESRRVID